MDQSEQIAELFLKHLGFTDVIYEPDGNVPPDFLVAGRIATEVRRLNKHVGVEHNPEALEKVQFPMLARIRGLLESIGPPNRGSTWFVTYHFGRPVESWSTLGPRVRKWLEAFRDGPQATAEESDFGGGFEVRLVRAGETYEQLFALGGYADQDSAGWLAHDLKLNIEHCASEKLRKTARFRDRYPEWWLILVDHIGYALSDFARDVLRDQLPTVAGWDRATLVSPLDPTHYLHLHAKRRPDIA